MKRLWIVPIVLLAASTSLQALEPGEVLVVANGNVPESVELAEYYAQVREIPPENVMRVFTGDEYAIARPAYEEKILEPIREHLANRQSDTPIRCICLMWGVPVRVEQTEQLPPPEMARFYAAEEVRQRQRLGIDRELIARIGREFPVPQTRGLEPLSHVFPGISPNPPRTPPTLNYLQENLAIELSQAAERVADLTDDVQRAIAQQQLLAVHLEVYGLAGLVLYLDEHRPDIAACESAYRQQLIRHLGAAQTKLDTRRRARPVGVAATCPRRSDGGRSCEDPQRPTDAQPRHRGRRLRRQRTVDDRSPRPLRLQRSPVELPELSGRSEHADAIPHHHDVSNRRAQRRRRPPHHRRLDRRRASRVGWRLLR
ncbi:MAG: TIGR03790 family protein [Planctomycetota bacterium]|jgi:hypothetical protein